MSFSIVKSVPKSKFVFSKKKEYSELNFKNPYLVSGSWRYRNAIFDMVHIYKVFDWDNHTMLVFGG